MARPKKIVLLADANEARLDVRQCVLETRGYRVLRALDTAGVQAQLVEQTADLVVAVGSAFTYAAKQIAPEVPVLELISNYDHASARAAAVLVGNGKTGPAAVELLERVRVMCAHKRGPKKVAAVQAVGVLA